MPINLDNLPRGIDRCFLYGRISQILGNAASRKDPMSISEFERFAQELIDVMSILYKTDFPKNPIIVAEVNSILVRYDLPYQIQASYSPQGKEFVVEKTSKSNSPFMTAEEIILLPVERYVNGMGRYLTMLHNMWMIPEDAMPKVIDKFLEIADFYITDPQEAETIKSDISLVNELLDYCQLPYQFIRKTYEGTPEMPCKPINYYHLAKRNEEEGNNDN